jgi:nitrogen fixation protein NifQ
MISDYEVMEKEVKVLLESFAEGGYAKNILAPLVARQAMMSNHLYQDLGFKNRTQMGKFMQKYFPTLAKMKPKSKLWKKFLFDTIDKVAPACATCSDQVNCFACSVEYAS